MESAKDQPANPLFTIGHSTRSADALIALLSQHGVTLLADVRTIPKSRKNPQFNADALPAALSRAGIAYAHFPGLGGLRRPRKDSRNDGWENASFRGYADYMGEDAFEGSLAELMGLAAKQVVAIMCAEAVPWRCHRSLIADALTVRNVPVLHIMGGKRAQPHALTRFARVEGTRITYSKPESST